MFSLNAKKGSCPATVGDDLQGMVLTRYDHQLRETHLVTFDRSLSQGDVRHRDCLGNLILSKRKKKIPPCAEYSSQWSHKTKAFKFVASWRTNTEKKNQLNMSKSPSWSIPYWWRQDSLTYSRFFFMFQIHGSNLWLHHAQSLFCIAELNKLPFDLVKVQFGYSTSLYKQVTALKNFFFL